MTLKLNLNAVTFLMPLLLLEISCTTKLSEKNRNEITDHISLKNSTKRLLSDFEDRNVYLKYLEISENCKEEKGDFFSYKKFKVKILVIKECLLNLKDNCAVTEIAPHSLKGFDESTIDLYGLKKYEIGDTLSFEGLLFSEDNEFNSRCWGSSFSKCVFYFIEQKNLSEMGKNQKVCDVFNPIFQLGLSAIKSKSKEDYKKLVEKKNKSNLNKVDIDVITFKGFTVFNAETTYELNMGKIGPLDFYKKLNSNGITLYYYCNINNLQCNFPLRTESSD